MSYISIFSLTVAALISTAVVWGPVAQAQSSEVAASTPKEIRKAERKAARAKKNAELKALESNGYKPGGDQLNYPQNLQNAEHKSSASKAANGTAASAP